MDEQVIEFDWMLKDEVKAHIIANKVTGEVHVEQFTNKVLEMFGGIWSDRMTYLMLIKTLEWRCFPRERKNADEILQSMGLNCYSPMDIVKITHGQMVVDKFWIRFDHEKDLTYNDIKF